MWWRAWHILTQSKSLVMGMYQFGALLNFLINYVKTLISTNNIARGMVCGSQIRFQSTKICFRPIPSTTKVNTGSLLFSLEIAQVAFPAANLIALPTARLGPAPARCPGVASRRTCRRRSAPVAKPSQPWRRRPSLALRPSAIAVQANPSAARTLVPSRQGEYLHADPDAC
jgi:hypothetical protein